MPTSSGRADPFNPWLEAHRDTVAYQAASWLGKHSRGAILNQLAICKRSAQAATVMCRPRCLFASLALVLEQTYTEGLNSRAFGLSVYERADRAYLTVLPFVLLLNWMVVSAYLALCAVVAELCKAVPCICPTASWSEVITASAAGVKVL